MSKPITSVALMTLYEQGDFQLNDPVSRVHPANGGTSEVYVSGEGENIVTRPPKQPMTFRNVLSHTGGLSYGGSAHPVDRAYRAYAAVRRGDGETLKMFVQKLGHRAAALRTGRALDVLVLHRRLRLPRRGASPASRSTSICRRRFSARWAWSTPASGSRRKRSTASRPTTSASPTRRSS